ncbi:MAG: hypothetical protein PVF58_05965 [Candidatus Methanofastidiosia archaeon]|jgi:hypothetical protein
MKNLSPEQKNLLKKYFKKFMVSKDFRNEIESREKQRIKTKNMLERDNLENMTEIEFGELISNLWASSIWSNKDYIVQKMISDNTIEKIRTQFNGLLYGTDPFEKRFDKFIHEVKGLGPASLTEILCLFDPEKYGIWNDRSRKALRRLKFDKLPLKKYYIPGKEYEKINRALTLIAEKLQSLGLSDADLLAVDYFLYEIWYTKEVEPKERFEFDHNEVRDFIQEIGAQLGFEADIEKPIARGARVDAVWRAKIANLGVVTYVFEVHKKGSIDSLILNLQRALNNPTVQKLIAVSDEMQLEKIEEEVKSLPENFRKALTLWEVSDAIETHRKLSEVIQSINRLELVKSQFEE